MKQYTFYFELFGKKCFYKCEARDENHAQLLLKSFILSRLKICKTIIEPIEPKEPKQPASDRSDKAFGEFKNIFEDFDKKFQEFFS